MKIFKMLILFNDKLRDNYGNIIILSKYISRQNLRDMILSNYCSLGTMVEHVPATRNLSPIQLFPHGYFFKAISGCMQLEYSMKITVSGFGFIICL